MRDLALKVVDAARGLNLVQKGDHIAIGLRNGDALVSALEDLYKALENFDVQVEAVFAIVD